MMKKFIQIIQHKCLRTIILFFSFGFSIYALCQTCPRFNLGFDYIGAMVGMLTLLVVFTVSWQICNAKEVKHGINKTKRAISQIKNLRKEINEQFVQMEDSLCIDYCIAEDYISASAIMKDAAYRYKDMYDKNITPPNMKRFLWSVEWIFRTGNIEDEKIKSALDNLLVAFVSLEKHDDRIEPICEEYKKRKDNIPISRAKIAGDTFSCAIKYAVKREYCEKTMYLKKDDGETAYHQFNFNECSLNEAHLFSTPNAAMAAYRNRTSHVSADEAVNSRPIIISVIESNKEQ